MWSVRFLSPLFSSPFPGLLLPSLPFCVLPTPSSALVSRKELESLSASASLAMFLDIDTTDGGSPATASPDMKAIRLHGFPGGPEAVELVARFCRDRGSVAITPANACVLRLAARFLEASGGGRNEELVALTEASLNGIASWSSSEVIAALRQCRACFPLSDSCGVLDRVLGSLLERVNSASEVVPSDSSPESSRLRLSFDTRSTTSTKNSTTSFSHRQWWLEDLAIFHCDAIGKIISAMMAKNMDHQFISRFLFHYLKTRCPVASPEEKSKIVEAVADMLRTLDRSSLPCKALFELLRLSLSSNVSARTREILDDMIGSNLNNATLDNMLIPAPAGIGTLYDVDRVLRFLSSFLRQCGGCSSPARLKKVGSLVDLYLAETAPDPGLKPRKFVSLAMALPNSARESFDAIYRAIDMYIEVHPDLMEEEKIMICCSLDYRKLSLESCKHLAGNAKMPPWTVIKALMFQQSKLRALLQSSSLACGERRGLRCREQTVLYAKRISASAESEKLQARLEGMQWKVTQLEDVCKKMRAQVRSTTAKTGAAARRRPSRFLPRLCS